MSLASIHRAIVPVAELSSGLACSYLLDVWPLVQLLHVASCCQSCLTIMSYMTTTMIQFSSSARTTTLAMIQHCPLVITTCFALALVPTVDHAIQLQPVQQSVAGN